jgi:dynein light chain LC8-type
VPRSFFAFSGQRLQAITALKTYQDEHQVAMAIKEYFDGKYGPNWHCFVGKHFAHFGSFEGGSYVSILVGQVAVLLYRM